MKALKLLGTSKRVLSHRQYSNRNFPPLSQPKRGQSAQEEAERAARLMSFLDSSPEPFHCVQTVSSELKQNGFTEIMESSPWNTVKPGGKYFFTKGKTSIVAFTVGAHFQPGNAFKVIGAHTDSPNLRIKPHSHRSNGQVAQLNVECYGGGLWHTWLDRDLSLAGVVAVRLPNGTIESRLVNILRPILRIPNLCIHLRPAEEREVIRLNKEDHLMPILCDEVNKSLSHHPNSWGSHQSPHLLELLREELELPQSSVIVSFDLSLYDTQPASLSGARREYLVGGRLDNLASCFVALESFITHSRDGIADDTDISMIALFDHAEVGSSSAVGAGSSLMTDCISRLSRQLHCTHSQGAAVHCEELTQISKSKSFIVSLDMAHAVHPNYSSRHDKHHSPLMNHGLVIKTNSNMRYASNYQSSLIIRELGESAGTPIQEFAVRNDCPCGSTIGPM